MKTMKRITTLLLVLCMILSIVPAQVMAISSSDVESQSSDASITIGDCITLGIYLGEPIVWRCVGIDENGPLMISEKILCLKAFDANGENSEYHSDGWGYIRKERGSNCWSDSNLRQWLNSNESIINWSHCPPTEEHVFGGYNAYDSEPGFLNSFTSQELSRVKVVTQKSYVNSWETTRTGYCDGGTNELIYWPSSTYVDYTNYYYQNVTDRFFLLNPNQVDMVYQYSEDYLLNAYPTQGAIQNSSYEHTGLSIDQPWEYWFGVPRNEGASYENQTLSSTIGGTQVLTYKGCYSGYYGVRPAFYLNVDGDGEFVTYIDAGTCGENLMWNLDSKGTLTISGSGAMDNYSFGDTPWNNNIDLVKKIIIENGVTSIDWDAMFAPYVTSINIPASVTSIKRNGFWWNGSLAGIWVDENNTIYSSDSDGVLFNKSKTKLHIAPCDLESYSIPNSVTSITLGAFAYHRNLKDIVISDSVASIGSKAFSSCDNLQIVIILNPNCTIADGEDTLGDSEITTIYCYAGSTAQSYAEKYGYTFVTISRQADEHSASLGDAWNKTGMGNVHNYLMSLPSISKMVLDSYNADQSFMKKVNSWKLLEYSYEPGNTLDDALSKKDYYSAILFSLIHSEITDENYVKRIEDAGRVEEIKITSEITDIVKSCAEIDHEKLLSGGTCTIGEVTALNNEINTLGDYSNAVKGVSDFLQAGRTLNDSINIYINYSNVKNTSTYIINVLEKIKKNTDDVSLIMAADEIIFAAENSFSAITTGIYNGTINAGKDFGVELINRGWQAALSSNPIGASMLIGYGIGKSLSNSLCATEAIISNYYEFSALYEVENSLKAAIEEFEIEFCDRLNANASLNYVNSVALGFKLYYLSVNYANDLAKYGLMCPIAKYFRNGEQDYEDIIEQNETLRSNVKEYENKLFVMWTYEVKRNYPDIYAEIAPSLGDVYTTDLADATIRLEYLSKTYTGEEIKPTVKVIMGDVVLQSWEYNVSYFNSVEPGVAKVQITAAKDSIYTGIKTVSYTIEDLPFERRISIQRSLINTPTVKSYAARSGTQTVFDLPDTYVYEGEQLVASVENGIITKNDLPVYITDSGIDVLMYNKNYSVKVNASSDQLYNAEIQKLDENLAVIETSNYNNLILNQEVQCNINADSSNEMIINDELLEPDFSSSDATDKQLYNINTTQCVAEEAAYENQRVYVSAIVPEGNVFVGWSVSPEIALSSNSDVTSFIMPAEEVSISASFAVNEAYFVLKNAIIDAAKLESYIYTESSYVALQQTIEACMIALTNDISKEVSQEKVLELQNAVNALVKSSPNEIEFLFSANGGTGIMSATRGMEDEIFKLPKCQFKVIDHYFAGWMIQRNDGLWLTDTNAWNTEGMLESKGDTKKIFRSGESITLDPAFVKIGGDHGYILHAVWNSMGENECILITDSEGNAISKFESLTDALTAAEENQTVCLYVDSELEDLILPLGVSFDLNGYTLMANSALTYSSSAIIDSSEDASGLLKVGDGDGNMISADNVQLPVYDAEAGGYRFFAMDVEPCAVTGNNKYWFKIKAENFALLYELIQADSEVMIKVKMTWDGQTEDTYAAADLSFTKVWADSYNENADIYVTVTATEAEGLENFKLIPIITSGGVEIHGEEMQ